MKKMLLALLLAVVSVSASAQFEQGTKYIGASVSGLNMSYNSNTKFNLGLQATGGYFLEDSWMVLGNLGWTHQGSPCTNDFTIGAGGRYYIQQNGLYLGLGLKYGHQGPHNVMNNLYLTPEVGYCFYLNHYLSIEPAIYYDMSLTHFSDCSTVGLKVGFGYYF